MNRTLRGAGRLARRCGGGRLCRFLGELSFPVYIMHFPLAYMQMAWVKAHASAPLAQHIAVNVSVYILAVAIAWAAYKLYDIPVRQWLSGKRKGQKPDKKEIQYEEIK